MKITDSLLTVNQFSRPGKKVASVKSIIMHWTGVPMQSARMVRGYFESRKNGKAGYGSAHYVIDFTGEIIRMIPDSEVAYHCGSDKTDPVSKKIYTDWARAKFGLYASPNSSPNNVTIGIELCTVDAEGNFRDATIDAAVELCAALCKTHGLKAQDIGTHNLVVGWKDCPRLWVNKPTMFSEFVARVDRVMV
jgi:N-acetylmuramoyl-L-alanine amidase